MPKKKSTRKSQSAVVRRQLPLSGADLAAKLADDGKEVQALSWAKRTANDLAADADDLNVAAQIFFKFQQYALSLACFDRLRERGSCSPEAELVYACSLATTGQHAKAVEHFQQHCDSDQPRNALRLAHYVETTGGVPLAIAILSQVAVSIAPDADLNIELARLLGNAGQREAALQMLQAAVEQMSLSESQLSLAWFFTGVFLEQSAAPTEAITQAYRASIEAWPQNVRALINLAILLNRSHQFAATIKLLEPVRHQFETEPKLAYLLAIAYRMEDRLEDAVQVLQQLVSVANSALAWELLGRLLTELNRNDEAVKHYRRWLAVEPGNPVASHMLAAIDGVSVPNRASAEYVAETFDAFADTFESALERLEYRGPQFMHQLLRENLGAPTEPPSRLVLDAGCGTGLIGPVLRPYAARLVGVDLSPAMLERARQKRIYDSLLCSDLQQHLTEHQGQYDLIVAADTFNYFGDLAQLLATALAALRESGWLMFTIEEGPLDGESFYLQPHGRYAHAPAYMIERMGECGLTSGTMNRVVMRKENDRDVHALLIAVQKPR